MSSRLRYLILSLVAGLLMWLSWPTSPGTVFIFIALTPLLWLTEQVRNKTACWGYVLLTFTVFNVGTTWWVGNTTLPASGAFANIFTALLMTIPFTMYRGTRKRLGRTFSYAALIVYWMTFEWVNLTWEFSWPWLSLGNVFAMNPDWVQWYEYTGVGGGTLWVLIVNILVYELYRAVQAKPINNVMDVFTKTLFRKLMQLLIVLFLVPFVFNIITLVSGASSKTLLTNIPKPFDVNVVIVQPNIDPYGKFSEGSDAQQLELFLRLSKQKADSNTQYIIWPETALFTEGAWEHELQFNGEVAQIRQFLKQYAPNAVLISGATTLKHYRADAEDLPYTARKTGDGAYDAFNAAVQIDTTGVQVYHKYELVPGAEMIPYVHYLAFMSTFALDFGGITGGYGRTPGVNLMTRQVKLSGRAPVTVSVAPAICYESVYGEYMAKQVREGASFSVIMTNDGWWGDSEGHRQHMQYARLRAIETRRWIARSANTGISAFVTPMGEVVDPQPYWQQAVIKQSVTLNDAKTFYVRHGDYLYKAAAFFCILLIIYRVLLRFVKRTKYVEGDQPGSI